MDDRTPGERLTTERLRVQLTAYVCGNILVLTVTALTTCGAHILSHDVGQQLGRARGEHRPHRAHEILDALPILVSGLVPAVILFVATFNFVPTQLAQLAAAVWVVGRLALIGFLVERLSGRRATWRTLSGGLVLALLSAVVVVLKVLFAH